MKMKTLTINGQTFIIVDAEAMRKLADSDLNMKGKLIYDAIIHANKLSFPGLNQSELVDVVSGSVAQGVPMLVFSGYDEGSMPVLRNIHDGIKDNDAVNRAQLDKAVEGMLKTDANGGLPCLSIQDETGENGVMLEYGEYDGEDVLTGNARLYFYGVLGDEYTRLCNIAPGVNDDEAATVGQLNQAIADAIANLPVYNGEVEEV